MRRGGGDRQALAPRRPLLPRAAAPAAPRRPPPTVAQTSVFVSKPRRRARSSARPGARGPRRRAGSGRRRRPARTSRASRIISSSSTPSENGARLAERVLGITCGFDAVHRPAGGDPGVVRRAGAELGAVAGDARVAADVARPRGVPQQVRVVELLPDEDQVRGGHELGDERAAGRRARKRVGPDAEPAVVVGVLVVLPELVLV